MTDEGIEITIQTRGLHPDDPAVRELHRAFLADEAADVSQSDIDAISALRTEISKTMLIPPDRLALPPVGRTANDTKHELAVWEKDVFPRLASAFEELGRQLLGGRRRFRDLRHWLDHVQRQIYNERMALRRPRHRPKWINGRLRR